MAYFLNFFYLFTILSFSKMMYVDYTIQFPIDKSNLESFYIISSDQCGKWIPSLLSPILLVYKDFNPPDWKEKDSNLEINPIFLSDALKLVLSNHLFLGKYNATIGRPQTKKDIINNCYFGLSTRLEKFNSISKDYILLNHLKNTSLINETIFSFDKWRLEGNNMESKLYFGDSHEKFSLNKEKGIIGSCKTNESDLYWGCLFDKISFDGREEELKNSSFDYKIYFSSENFDIIIPESFEDKFKNLTDYKCNATGGHSEFGGNYLECENFFNESQEYAYIELSNKEMDIKIEIDKYGRYIKGNYSEGLTRIIFKDLDYFVFPLIMFKRFHIQFDDKNGLISFYTNDSSILNVKKKEKKKEEGSSSKGLIVFLIILIIVIVVVLLYGVLWFIKRRKGSIEKNINKYNKFEDEENYQDLKENRVF